MGALARPIAGPCQSHRLEASAYAAGRVLPASGGSIGLDFFPPVGGHGA